MRIKFYFLPIIYLLVCSCGSEVSFQREASTWRKLNCGLFMNKNGDLAYATKPVKALIPYSKKNKAECPNVFITSFGYPFDSNNKTLIEIIDTNSFISLEADYFKDKNHIYSYYGMCDGGYFQIFADDTASFRTLSSSYVQYKSKVYFARNREIISDATSFKVIGRNGHIAHDENSYFLFDERLSKKALI
jgi:hypothetical protein